MAPCYVMLPAQYSCLGYACPRRASDFAVAARHPFTRNFIAISNGPIQRRRYPMDTTKRYRIYIAVIASFALAIYTLSGFLQGRGDAQSPFDDRDVVYVVDEQTAVEATNKLLTAIFKLDVDTVYEFIDARGRRTIEHRFGSVEK